MREGKGRERERETDSSLGIEPDTANPRILRPQPEPKIKSWRLNQLSYPGVLYPGYLTLKTKTLANGTEFYERFLDSEGATVKKISKQTGKQTNKT